MHGNERAYVLTLEQTDMLIELTRLTASEQIDPRIRVKIAELLNRLRTCKNGQRPQVIAELERLYHDVFAVEGGS